MDLRHIRAFIAVADALSVTKAAERLNISQPPLTRQIHHLERELGVTLFERHRRGVTLTDAGRRLLDKAQALEALAADFFDAAREAAAADSSTIRVGIGWGLWEAVNKARVEFSRQHPDVTIAATDVRCSSQSEEQLRNRSLDIVFARPPFDPAFRVVGPIFYERVQAIFSDGSPLAVQSSVSVRELAREPLLLWDRHIAPVLYDRILELYARVDAGTSMIPTPGAGPFNHAGIMLVASGKGVYLGYGVPSTEPHAPSGVTVRPVSDPDAVIEVCVVTRSGEHSPLVVAFLESVSRVFSLDRRLRTSAEVA